MKKMTALVFALAMMLGLGGKAMAQDIPDMPDMDFSDTEIQSFVDVQPALQSIRNDYSARLEGVDDPQTAASLQQEASSEMIEAIERNGLDLETYNLISTALQSDMELRDRVEQLLNELAQG